MRLSKRLKKISRTSQAYVRAHPVFFLHLLIFVSAFSFFIIGIDNHYKIYFDEEQYVPGAIDLISIRRNSNWSHPPLGKLLIGFGIWLFGDHAFGWRVMSVVFGALTLNGMFALGLVLFKNYSSALLVVAICLLNQLLFVISRVAVLEPFMICFITWGFVFTFRNFGNARKRQHTLAGFLFGLAMAVKWFAVVPMAICIGLLLSNRKVTWKNRLKAASSFLVFPTIGYFAVIATFLVMRHPKKPGFEKMAPDYYYHWDLIKLQWGMLQRQLDFITEHPFPSPWYEWPYRFYGVILDQTQYVIKGALIFYSIILIGNPLILWLGAISVLVCIYAWIWKRNETAKLISVMYLGLWLSWAIIPRKITFYFYYIPASLILGLSLVFAWQYFRVPRKYQYGFLFLCVLIFVYFYPLLSWIPVEYNSERFHYLFKYWGWKHPIGG